MNHLKNNMKNHDFDTFKQECSWFIQQTDSIELTELKPEYEEHFINTFPILYQLLLKARVTQLTLRKIEKKKELVNHYRLYAWDTLDGHRAGWLCKIEANASAIMLLPEHQLLIDNMGGILESYWQEPESDKLTDNQNFLFIKSECELMSKEDRAYYFEICEEEGCQPIDTKSFLAFAVEANGNSTYYDLQTDNVFLFASDHAFDNITSVEGQPEYTFYTIDNVNNFTDYVELLAKQWLAEIV